MTANTTVAPTPWWIAAGPWWTFMHDMKEFGREGSARFGPAAFYICNGPRYDTFVRALPSFDASQLVPPPNTRILFFGMSYLQQLSDNILVANRERVLGGRGFRVSPALHCLNAETCTCNSSSSSSSSGSVIEPSFSEHRITFARSDDSATPVGEWTLDSNTSLTFVYNSPELQHSTCDHRLSAFLASRPRFDLVFFMMPHPDCFFLYQGRMRAHRPATKCVDLREYNPRHAAAARYHALFRAHASKVFEVVPWNEPPRQHAQRTSTGGAGAGVTHAGAAAVSGGLSSRTSTHDAAQVPLPEHRPAAASTADAVVDDDEAEEQRSYPTIHTIDLVHARPCLVHDCSPSTENHQCSPGVPTLLAAELMRRAHRALGLGGAHEK